MALTEYARKRNFKKTSEPVARGVAGKKGNRFVIQKHAASRLHYDFRLELDGVLKSWAVPKGLPLIKGEKRLAIHVEDHPVGYIDFEGTIPKGQYGGGTVMVWDQGAFSTPVEDPLKNLATGKLHFTLAGKKLKGDWHLVQLRGSDQWLIIKGGDDHTGLSKKADDTSALSGRSMKQISGSDKVWQSTPSRARNSFAAKISARAAAAVKLPSLPASQPFGSAPFIAPMEARLVQSAPPGGDYIYEIKFDGYRAQASTRGGVSLLSRNEKDFREKFPEIMEAVAALKIVDATFDGEIVALDEYGVSNFQLLQAYELGEKRPPIYYYVFDLLRLRGKDLLQQPLMERKAQLERIVGKHSGLVRYSASLGEDSVTLLQQARRLGLEGLIGKNKQSIYEAGRRSGAWLKLKLHREQEFVIGGYTDPEGARPHFGALLLGVYEKGKLIFSGKVGTGFNGKLLERLNSQFKSILSPDCPFSNLPEKKRGRFGAGLTASEMKHCHWLQPKMVAKVKFSNWTRDEKLRQPVFLGLREDKGVRDVVREKAF